MKDVEYELLNNVLLMRAFTRLPISSEDILLIMRSAGAKSIEILKDQGGEHIGYIIWSSINKYSVWNFINNSVVPKYNYESAEGNICCILSTFIMPGRSSEAFFGIRGFIRKRRVVTYMRKGKATCLFRVNNSFYRAASKKYSSDTSATKKAVA